MTSTAVRNAERSSLEVKDLLRKLHPSSGNHKDRIRRLNKFRNYVQPSSSVVRACVRAFEFIVVCVFVRSYACKVCV